MRALLSIVATLGLCGTSSAQSPPAWWPFPGQEARPSAQAAAAQPAAQAQVVQAQAITLPALPVYSQPAAAPVTMRYVGPGPMRRAIGGLGEKLAGLKRGHYVAEPPPVAYAPQIAAATAAPQAPIVVLVSMPAPAPVQPVAAPSPQSIQAATAAPPPPKAPPK